MSNHSPAGIMAPMEQWTHDDLVTWMQWQIIEGITAGKSLGRICYDFPHMVFEWEKAKKEVNSHKKGA